MRVYIPLTLGRLRALPDAGLIAGADSPLLAHAVTPAVTEWYTEGDQEELEFTALLDAARTCLDLIAAEPGAHARRVVVAADVPDVQAVAGGEVRSQVTLTAPVPLSAVVSVHVDEVEAERVVAAAVAALPAVAGGDEEAEILLEDAEDLDLLWFDVTEIEDVP